MKNKPINPFLVQGYHSPEYFCDREKETEKIIKALRNGRNISLISPRRMGKTGLIKHVFYNLLETDKDINCFYFDIFPTRNLNDLCNLFAQTVIGKLDSKVETIFKKISSVFKNIRFSLSYESVSGNPKISYEVVKDQEQYALDEIFSYLENSGKECYIAIDEFQQITEYPEKNVEALLRSHIQFHQTIHFIFSGSKRTLMEAIFSDSSRPFYQSTQKISLTAINIESYRFFAVSKFQHEGRTLSADVFDYLYQKVDGHTWYVQYVLNELYATTGLEIIKNEHVDNAIQEYNAEEQATFQTYCDSLTPSQFNLLLAIAEEIKVSEITSQEFIRKHSLSSPSGVSRAIESLMSKSLVFRDETNKYVAYNKFFAIWLCAYKR